MSSPLLHPDVVHALARQGGVSGRGDRTATLRALVSDLLPDAVIAGRTRRRSTGRSGRVTPGVRRALERRRRGHRAGGRRRAAPRVAVGAGRGRTAQRLFQQAWLATEGRGRGLRRTVDRRTVAFADDSRHTCRSTHRRGVEAVGLDETALVGDVGGRATADAERRNHGGLRGTHDHRARLGCRLHRAARVRGDSHDSLFILGYDTGIDHGHS